MFARSAARALSTNSRTFSSSAARHTKVAVLGAGGGIGQPLSLLLKSDALVTSLNLYDIRGAPGVAADVSHVDTPSEVCCFHYLSLLLDCLIKDSRSKATLLTSSMRPLMAFKSSLSLLVFRGRYASIPLFTRSCPMLIPTVSPV